MIPGKGHWPRVEFISSSFPSQLAEVLLNPREENSCQNDSRGLWVGMYKVMLMHVQAQP